MRALHVIPAVAPQYGGPSAAVVPMCDALEKTGVNTLLVTTNADGERTLNVPVDAPTAWHGVRALFFNRDFSESFKYSSSLARWLRRHVREFDVVHIHAVLSHASLSAASACRTQRVPYVLRPLGTLAPWSLRQKAIRKRVMLALGARRAILAAGALHCTSDEERRGIERAFPGANAVVIPLGIDSVFFDETPVSWPERNSDRYVLALSRIHPKKNLEALIEAFLAVTAGQHEPWRLVIAGDGEAQYVEGLRQLARQKGGDGRVTFPGWVDGLKKRALIQKASLFALASFHENFGVSVLEALASGVPAILSSEVDLSETVRQHGAGWIVEPAVDSLRAGLTEALSDPVERSSRAASARVLAKRFAWPGIAMELSSLYQRLRLGSTQIGDQILSSATTAGR
jgi:glycosyltransferase involved in cell wall biosynthesis